MDERFIRLEQLLGGEALEKLEKATIAIFGLGAVGSYCLESLARSGVGEFILIDFDQVRRSNFNRQLLALAQDEGRLKTEVARERVLRINPQCQVTIHSTFAAVENFTLLLAETPDCVVDAIDSLTPKTDLIAYCTAKGIPFISAMGAGGKTDPFSVRIGDIGEATTCALAKRLKKELNQKGVTEGVRCVYSTQRPLKTSVCNKEEELYQRGRPRRPVGTISYMPALFGLMLAYEVIRGIVGESLLPGDQNRT
jgi:tRNA threonylcarbamoyladenosine dehydratase